MKKKTNLKKMLACILGCFLVLIPQFSVFAAQSLTMNYDGKKVKYSDTIYKITIDGKELKTDFPGIVFNKTTMLPVRAVFEKLGGKVVWNSKTQVMDVSYNGLKLQFKNNDINTKMDGKTYKLTTQAKKINDRLIIPVDFIKNIKSLSATVDSKSKSINIKTVKAAPPKNENQNVKPEKPSEPVKDKPADEPEKVPVKQVLSSYLTYVSNQDRVYFAFKGIALTSTGSTIKKYFTENYDKESGRYTITISAKANLKLAENTYKIDDDYVDSIAISRNKETLVTNFDFNVKKEFTFYTSYNEDLKQTEVNLLTPAKEGERLVVIDAGHGGVDPGASGGSTREKDVNLDIALKLEKLLKAKNVNTFMLRQDDTFVGLYDRPYIANALNATLFLSIHNNSFDKSTAKGTETLYYPEKAGDKSFTGQKFAQLIQNSLMSRLDTYNRKTVSRPGLVVLKYTHMPSSLAEIGFLSNPGDLQRLNNQDFQQKTAEALCDAIVKGLDQINKEQKNKKEENKKEESKEEDNKEQENKEEQIKEK
ncbi:N-acetylmuramoyl-L-alanine amidase [Clostridium sp. BNL1100]|uniref:N-acetylmuramoyl-L-alanine amidase n=1 Tax=Clostridium sp. BNL1100 TaxID=755731 RepID=UPI00024A7A41|nr:N-acetylmuramoyl-L-alanine amidase [Clostridium sp. BNL1100]AEY65287.1 N-acetylmuramoyl-L-alanine amidase [Clostridium sp. BNL1100]